MEYQPGGDLLSLLAKHDDVFEEEMARFYLAEITMAIHSLHQLGFVHRYIIIFYMDEFSWILFTPNFLAIIVTLLIPIQCCSL